MFFDNVWRIASKTIQISARGFWKACFSFAILNGTEICRHRKLQKCGCICHNVTDVMGDSKKIPVLDFVSEHNCEQKHISSIFITRFIAIPNLETIT